MPVNSDAIGIDYQIDLAKLADSIRAAKTILSKFHTDLTDLAKKASITITVNDKAASVAKTKVKKFASAIQAELDKSGVLKLKAVPESFGKIGGLTPRLTEDYKKLYDMFGRSPEILGKVNTAFKRVNNSISEQALRMQNAGRNGIGFYETANRVNLVQQELRGTLKATSTGFKNVALETSRAAEASEKATQKRAVANTQLKQTAQAARETAIAEKQLATASISATNQLKLMGITSTTTSAQIKAMNLSALETARVLELTRMRMKELSSVTLISGRTTKAAEKEYAILQSRMPHLQDEANKGVKAFGDYRRAMDRWGQGFKYMMLSQAAWIASGAVLFGTITAIGTSIKTFVDFHQDLRDTAAIVQATTTGYEKMEKAAVKAFLNSTMSLKDTTNALKILGQTGMEASESAIALETVYKITTATGGDMATVVKFLTTAINVWKLGAEDAAKVGNVLGAALNYSKLEVEDLGTTFNYVANMAHAVGLSIEDLAATMAVMSNAGIKASTIGTGLRGVFTKLLAVTPKFEKELAKVGLSIEDVNIRTQGFFKVLSNLEKAGFDIGNIFKGMTRREAAAMTVLLGQGTERMNLMREALKDTTAVEVMFTRSMAGMKNQIILTGHAIQQFLIGGLSVLKPVITGTARFVGELFKALDELRGILLLTLGTWAAYRTALILISIATDGVAAATSRLSKVFLFLNKHRFFLVMTGLILTYTSLRMAIDSTTEALNKQLDGTKRTIDDLRKLQILMQSSNKTEEEKLEILSDYAKDYPGLLDLLEKHKINIEDITKATGALIIVEQERAKEIKRQMLLQNQADLQRIQGLLRIATKQKEIFEKEGGFIKGGIIKFGLDPSIKKYKDQIRDLSNDIRRLKIDLGIIVGGKIDQGPSEEIGFKWLPAMEEALEKLKLKTGSEREQAKKELIKDLDFYGMTEDQKTTYTAKQTEARILVYRKYYEALKKIEEKEWSAHNRAIEKIQAAIKRQEAELERTTDKERSTKNNLSKFKESLIDDEAKLIKDDYEQRRILLEKEIVERQRKYDELLAKTKDFYEDVSKLAEKNPLLLPEKDKIDALVKELEKNQAEIDRISGRERKGLLEEHPTNIAGGIKEGLRLARKELSNEYDIWKNLTANSAMAMRDSFSDLFFDAMKGELKSLGDYWQAFTNAVKRQIADMAASWITSGLFGKKEGGGLFGTVIGAIGNLFKHEGGQIKKMHSGGLAGNETLRILKENEYVIKDSSARSIGLAPLNYMNKTGKIPSSGGTTHINNSYTIIAMDSESIDQALRRGGAKAIQDISIGSYVYESERRNRPAFGMR